jgi:signal transduction histidine kinase/CheY-like chemotaxis protein
METEDLYVFQNKCLKAMGVTLNVSRIYIFEHHHETDTMDNTFEWVGEGVLPQKDELQGVSAEDSPWWMKVLKSNQVINFSDIEDIPDEGAKTILGLQGILSILVVPLFTAGQYYGFLGFDDCIRHREWSESDAEFLQAVGRIMTGAVEQKRAEDEREKLQEQLSQAQKMESVGRLAGGVAHDFNNMLGVILGHTELALLQADENHDLYSDLIEIQKAAKRSANTTKQLLAFARKDIISPRQLDLNDTVESMLNMLRRLIGEDIDLSWLPAKKLWSVKMDPSQIDQILANLCVNARDAISGVGKLTIETGIKTFDEAYCKDNPGFIPGDFVLLAVSDNGCGMDKDTLDNLFEPFFTTKEVGKGTGLGLATIYGIVKQNNGFINVYSESGRGSTFNIYLPRLVDDESTDTDVPEKKAAAGGTETILLVEDDPSILRMTRMMLERKGYSVLTAATPSEAIKLAKIHAEKIHLLMTDVVMPEMNGRDLAGQIIALYPDIRLLFMSGYTADVIAHQGILDDGVTFIQKPFSMADMTDKVREVLDIAPDKN